jgi:hypothetical protein
MLVYSESDPALYSSYGFAYRLAHVIFIVTKLGILFLLVAPLYRYQTGSVYVFRTHTKLRLSSRGCEKSIALNDSIGPPCSTVTNSKKCGILWYIPQSILNHASSRPALMRIRACMQSI